MGPNRRRLEREEARAGREERRRRDEAHQLDIAATVQVIKAWNARLAEDRATMFSPTIGAALLTGHHWLTVHCPGCGLVSDVDVSKLDRHPGASLASLIPALSCRNCRPHAPFARLMGLSRHIQNRNPTMPRARVVQ